MITFSSLVALFCLSSVKGFICLTKFVAIMIATINASNNL